MLIFAGDISIRIEEHLDKMLTEAARQSGIQEEFGLWKINQTGDADIDEPFEDVVTTQEEYELIKFDVKLEDKIPSCPGDLDIPYRGVLKTLITRCASQEERREVIKIFYDNFNETAAK